MKRSFTLIEILVVIVILALLIVGGVSALGVKRKEKDVKTTAEKLRTYIMEARSMAMTPKDTSFGLHKIQVRIYFSGSKVELWEVKTDGSSSIINLNFEIPRNTTIAPPDPGASDGNMKRDNPGQYYYFSFIANDTNLLGQVPDSDIVNKNNPIKINVVQTNKTYQLVLNAITGNGEVDEL